MSSLTLVTEAAPDARGKAIGISNALGTLARSAAVILSGQLYEAFGISGSLAMAGVAATAAFSLTAVTAVRLHRTTARLTAVTGRSAPSAQHGAGELRDDVAHLVGVRVGAEVTGARGAPRARLPNHSAMHLGRPPMVLLACSPRIASTGTRDLVGRPRLVARRGRRARRSAPAPRRAGPPGWTAGSLLPPIVADQASHEPLGGRRRVVHPLAGGRSGGGARPPVEPRQRRLVHDDTGDEVGTPLGGGERDVAAVAVAHHDRRAGLGRRARRPDRPPGARSRTDRRAASSGRSPRRS